jgi:hypothetical protein
MTEITGTDLVRQALRGRNKKVNLATTARDLGISSDRLDAFVEGRVTLSPETMQALVDLIWHGHIALDIEHDMLKPANKAPPVSLGIAPAPFDPRTSPYAYKPGPPALGPQPVKALPAKPKTTRAGSLGGWL